MQRGKNVQMSSTSAPPPVLFVTEARLARLADGSVVSPDGVNGDAQWRDYLPEAAPIALSARVALGVDGQNSSPETQVTIPRVVPVHHYEGLRGFLVSLPRVVADLDRAVRDAGLVVVRVPGFLGYVAAGLSLARRKPMAAEVVGDPLDVMNALHGTSRAGRAAACAAALALRTITSRAAAVRYVTEAALQRRYPARKGTPTMALGNVRLPIEAYRDAVRSVDPQEPLRLLVIGSQNNRYKGHDTALRVLALLRRRRDAFLTLIGDGAMHDTYRELAAELGIESSVRFLGHVTDRSVIHAEMDRADVMLMPSRTEGLPRVINEAHARSLPVVGARVGGIPEQVVDAYLVDPEDIDGYAQCVEHLADDADAYASESRRAYARALELNEGVRRRRFREWGQILAGLRRA